MPTTARKVRKKWYGLIAATRASFGQRELLGRPRLDLPQRIGDAPLVAPAWPVREAARAGKRRGNRTRKAQGQFFELAVVAVVARGLCGGEQRHERGQRRQRRDRKHRRPCARYR